MVHLEIDGRPLEAEEDRTLLDVAREAGIEIPTLCYHDGLEAWGGCRLCMVEVGHPDWGGWTDLVTACLYPVRKGIVVSTASDNVMEVRRTVLDLLLARSPGAVEIRKLAAEYGIRKTSFVQNADTGEKCIMCTLCVRVCDAIGASAIGTVGRGEPKRIAPPFDLPPDACIGCFSCVNICPTDAIDFAETTTSREIWGRKFELIACEGCRRPLMTVEQRVHEAARGGLPEDDFGHCADCKRKRTAENIAKTFAPLN